MRKTLSLSCCLLLLIFTGAGSSRADPSQSSVEVRDAPADRSLAAVRSGPSFRFGTMVGHTRFGGERITTLGGTVAGGARLGPVSGELELASLSFRQPFRDDMLAGNRVVGSTRRVGATLRLDVASLGPNVVGDTSTIIFWVEAGVGTQWVRWQPGDQFRRHDAIAGGGWTLDHRLKRPLGFPSRIGWHFGWRVTGLERPRPMGKTALSCKAVYCIDDDDDPYEFGLLVTSSVQLSW